MLDCARGTIEAANKQRKDAHHQSHWFKKSLHYSSPWIFMNQDIFHICFCSVQVPKAINICFLAVFASKKICLRSKDHFNAGQMISQVALSTYLWGLRITQSSHSFLFNSFFLLLHSTTFFFVNFFPVRKASVSSVA